MGLFSSLFGSGSKSAYDTRGLADSVNSSNALYKDIWQQSESQGQPWLDLGKQGVSSLSSQLGGLTTPFGEDKFQADPGYQFTLDEGQKAIQRAASANGSAFAPSTAKALTQYTTGLANQTYGDAFNRNLQQNNSIYDMFMGASNVGQQQAGQNAQYGYNYADAVSNNNIGLQNAILGAAQSKNANTQSMLGNWMNLAGRIGSAAAGRPG